MSLKCAYCDGLAPEGMTLDGVPWCGCNAFIPEREPRRVCLVRGAEPPEPLATRMGGGE